jgi:hypothetical protein
MPAQVKFRRDAKSDMMTVEVLTKGRLGIVQIRAVAPLKPIRNALRQRLQRAGVQVAGDPIEISARPWDSSLSGRSDGRDSRVGCSMQGLERATCKVACCGLMEEMKKAAQPHLAQGRESATRKHKLLKRIKQLVQFAHTDKFESCGGWEGVEQAFQRKRTAQHSALMARGTSKPQADRAIQALLNEDAIVVSKAQEISENPPEDDSAGDESMDGWRLRNPFKKKRAPAPAPEPEGGEDGGEPVDASQPPEKG